MIKWKRLKQISEQVTGIEVNIYGSTKLEGLRAAIEFNEEKADVALNLNMNKGIEELISSLAHELAHVTVYSTQHNREHSQESDRLRDKINKLYRKENENEDGEH